MTVRELVDIAKMYNMLDAEIFIEKMWTLDKDAAEYYGVEIEMDEAVSVTPQPDRNILELR